MSKYAKEIEKHLRTYPARTSAHNPEAYIGGGQSQWRYIGLRVPHLREAMKRGFSFSQSPDQARIWDEIWWSSDCFEVMAMALDWFYHPKQQRILRSEWPRLRRWAERIDNWAHSDSLSGIYARIHEEDPRLVLPTFKKWNASKNSWLRRQSIVSLFYYSSQREKYPPFELVTQMLEPQFEFDHYYVQKGVGWTLRELGNVYSAQTYDFLLSNVARISSHAFSAAVEKLPDTKREKLKRLRRKA